MNTVITFTVDIADVIPIITGSMVFASVLLAGTKKLPKIRLAWVLGLSSQLLLVGFGVLTEHYSFGTHLLVAAAFAVNIWRFRLQKTDVPKQEIRTLDKPVIVPKDRVL